MENTLSCLITRYDNIIITRVLITTRTLLVERILLRWRIYYVERTRSGSACFFRNLSIYKYDFYTATPHYESWKKGLCHCRNLYPKMKKMNARCIHSCWWSWWFCVISALRGIIPSREDRVTTLDSFHFSDSGQAESVGNRYVPSGWSNDDDDDDTYIRIYGARMSGTINHKARK